MVQLLLRERFPSEEEVENCRRYNADVQPLFGSRTRGEFGGVLMAGGVCILHIIRVPITEVDGAVTLLVGEPPLRGVAAETVERAEGHVFRVGPAQGRVPQAPVCQLDQTEGVSLPEPLRGLRVTGPERFEQGVTEPSIDMRSPVRIRTGKFPVEIIPREDLTRRRESPPAP
jgi:hypothetical protein